jgi:hypothetical protein
MRKSWRLPKLSQAPGKLIFFSNTLIKIVRCQSSRRWRERRDKGARWTSGGEGVLGVFWGRRGQGGGGRTERQAKYDESGGTDCWSRSARAH